MKYERAGWNLQVAKKELDAAIDRADVIGRDFAHVVEENKRLKASITTNNKKRMVVCLLIVGLTPLMLPRTRQDVSQLEDSISCEICTLKMWTPYMSANCLHLLFLTRLINLLRI